MRRIIFIVLFICLTVNLSWCQVPETISFQGYLVDTDGIPVSDGNYSITFN